MSFVERVNQGETLASWLNWLTEPPAVCWSVIMGDLSASCKGENWALPKAFRTGPGSCAVHSMDRKHIPGTIVVTSTCQVTTVHEAGLWTFIEQNFVTDENWEKYDQRKSSKMQWIWMIVPHAVTEKHITSHVSFAIRTTRTPEFWGYPPPPHDISYDWFILDPKSKEDKVKVTNLKNLPKFQIFEFWNKHYTRHTFWSCLIGCTNMKWFRRVLLKIQSGHDSVHRRTDGRTDGKGEISIHL